MTADGFEPVLDLPDFSDWVGTTRTRTERIAPWPARALAAALDQDPAALAEGVPLPHGWHWMYFHDPVRRSGVGPDGHEARGAFLPPIPLPRRMWAGGRIRFGAPLRLGDEAVRTSVVERITPKTGRSGTLVFVTVRHTVTGPEGLAVEEEQDLVYRAPPPPADAGAAAVTGADGAVAPPSGSEVVTPFRADEVLLFRFSALTFNGHRIHYDHPYTTGVEGYPGLVVHGPLLALLLLGAGVARTPGDVRRFSYRALSPVFCGEDFQIRVAPSGAEDGGLRLWAFHPARGPAMEASVE